uniref:Protein kinase domain-containing protein n=1 Tax=Glossina morsitans morsitans TaxID=37546 RepID=A0A1B0FDK2_GLOMM
MAHHNANLLSSDISRRNPQDEYELIQKIGSGTYGDVYKYVLTKTGTQPLAIPSFDKLLGRIMEQLSEEKGSQFQWIINDLKNPLIGIREEE